MECITDSHRDDEEYECSGDHGHAHGDGDHLDHGRLGDEDGVIM